MSAFERALTFVLAAEGGAAVTNDPADPGGITRWGISQRAHPGVDIANLTRDQAAELYRQHYWLPARCDHFPEAVALVLFDAAVNQGVVPAVRSLQRALGVEDDGVVGSDTISAARERDVAGILVRFAEQRFDRYWMHPQFTRFGRGWTRRLFRGLSDALLLAAAQEA
jgi:lysozyme family protein